MAVKKSKTINETAQKYQNLDREMKKLEAEMKPLKKQLLDYAKENQGDFDEAFQLKFPCGTYVSLRVSDSLKADERANDILLSNLADQYLETKLIEKVIIEAAKTNKLLMKQLTQAGAAIEQKETLAVYAG